MIIVPKSTNPEDFLGNFSLRVTPGEMKTFARSLLGKEEFIGHHSHNRFKLMKVYPSWTQRRRLRHFQGELVQANGRLEVHGQFRHTPFGILLYGLSCVFVLSATIPMAINANSWIFLAFAAFLLGAHTVSEKQSTKQNERDIIQLIESL